jgi:hypothetical protein
MRYLSWSKKVWCLLQISTKLYKIHNDIYWDRYHQGFITGEELKWKRLCGEPYWNLNLVMRALAKER